MFSCHAPKSVPRLHESDQHPSGENNPLPPRVSVVIPFFDEAENLGRLAAELRQALENTGEAYELVFVDDGSGDRGAEEVSELQATDPRLRLLRLPENRGQSTALAVGLAHAAGEVVVTIDADLQNDPADIPRLLAALEDCDVVSGVRTRRQDSWMRRFSSRVANRVRSRVLGDSITDAGCSLKAYRAQTLRDLPLFDGAHRFLPALAEMHGARVRELPVHHRPRRHGESKYGVRNRLGRGLLDLWGVRWLKRRRINRKGVKEVRP